MNANGCINLISIDAQGVGHVQVLCTNQAKQLAGSSGTIRIEVEACFSKNRGSSLDFSSCSLEAHWLVDTYTDVYMSDSCLYDSTGRCRVVILLD